MTDFIRPFNQIHISDTAIVGGKNASLGEMITSLSSAGIRVPEGFATTASAFWYFLDSNKLREPLHKLMDQLDKTDFSNLSQTGEQARQLILSATLPRDLAEIIQHTYFNLCMPGETVAVRSSATAEDLPQASFAGQHESYLNIHGGDNILKAVKDCFASLYTNRAIKYREDQGFPHHKVALSVGIQKMVRSDKACSGIGFTLEPESGFRDIVHLSGVWGLGENIVQGAITPDEFYVFKPTLKQGKDAIIQKRLGTKEKTLIYAEQNSNNSTINIDTPLEKRNRYVLTSQEIELLAKWAIVIEDHYQQPMDIEWAKDGYTNELFIIQARPETVHSHNKKQVITEYSLKKKGKVLAQGEAIGTKVTNGIARILDSPKEADKLQPGEIIITDITSPDWDPILKKAAAIVTNKGGRTSHASIVARELGVPAIVGAGNATGSVREGSQITISCCEGRTGFVYEGKLEYAEKETDVSKITMPDTTQPMLITGDPEKAFQLSMYPNNGVGLMRMEFIITHHIRIHPMALVKFDAIGDPQVKNEILKLTSAYPDKKEYFIEKLSEGIATIAAAFYPKDVIVRMSDFKTNEYANLLGGKDFEPSEENPMIGFRGASRYYNERYKEGFRLECAAIKKVREKMGFQHVKVMIPFCRTVEEGKKVLDVMKEFGLNRQQDPSLEIYMMVEIPSNVLQADEFADLFNGFSIGSNDLTQLTLGIDRDSSIVSDLFSEQNKSARTMISMAIEKAKAKHIKIGLCGQAPSDFPEFTRFLVEAGIDSISFNADALLKGIENIHKAEKHLSLSM
ncbi:phosphoenolpyruvate synthase [Pseudoflavitalea rhizosphaerae]|uniref:phosphoenolpyruvate synthase n=1 Tax=Pseudoflavitalea rhizosphaerae TaxID=1884793 RepID=UPI000F8D7D2B|nr:phosphoenolpyruvate synthase [Pseudoflavitalea rhizosphaerae]